MSQSIEDKLDDIERKLRKIEVDLRAIKDSVDQILSRL